MPLFLSSLGAPQLCLLRGLFLAVCESSPALDRDGNWGPSHTLSFHLCELSDVERLTDCGKRREGGGTQMAREMDRQTGLPVGRDPWAPCLGEGSFSASILPCWGALRERIGEL